MREKELIEKLGKKRRMALAIDRVKDAADALGEVEGWHYQDTLDRLVECLEAEFRDQFGS